PQISGIGNRNQPGTQTDATSTIEPWRRMVVSVAWRSVAPCMWQSYEKSFNDFVQFQDQEGQSAIWPITEEQVLRYMLSLATRQLASSTFSNCLSAITFVSRINVYPDPCSGFLV
ncbi:hypothetical protein KIL84_003903, partial [Mauremys mutica]